MSVDLHMADSDNVYTRWRKKIRRQTIIDYIGKERLEKASVLDVGCGTEQWLQHHCRIYVGVDPKLNTSVFDIPDIEYDLGVLLDVTEHIPDSKLDTILRRMRVCREIFIHTPNADCWLERLKTTPLFPQVIEHEYVRSGREYFKLLGNAGWKQCWYAAVPHYLPGLRALVPGARITINASR